MGEKIKNKKLLLIIIAVLVAVVIAVVMLVTNKNEEENPEETESTTNWAEELADAGLSPYNTSLSAYDNAEFTVDFIDVEQGDCALVSCNDKHMLVDCGEAEYYEVVKHFLENKGVEKLDIVIVSHPHTDHMGGMSKLFNDFAIGTLIMPEIGNHKDLEISVYETFQQSLEEHSINVVYPEAEDTFSLDKANVTIIAPLRKYREINNMSVIAMVEFEGKKFLFTGDAEERAELRVLRSNANLDCDVLKVAHHGSDSSSAEEFIKASSPEIAVISVAQSNEYNHPDGKSIRNLLKEDAEIYRTDLDGTISFYIFEDEIIRNV